MGCAICRWKDKETTPSSYLWPNNRIPFRIEDASFAHVPGARGIIESAIAVWNATGEVYLVDHGIEKNHVVFRSDSKMCQSPVGMQGKGVQVVACGGSALDVGSVLHEIGHAMGLFHEHQRVDRNDHVTVGPAVATDPNFRVESDALAIGAYDCESIMHYPQLPGQLAIQPGCATMVQHERLSPGDVATARWLREMSSQFRRYTRDSCSRELVVLVGSSGDVHLRRGFGVSVPVVKSWDNIRRYCRDAKVNDPGDTDIPKNTGHLKVIRGVGFDFFDFFAF